MSDQIATRLKINSEAVAARDAHVQKHRTASSHSRKLLLLSQIRSRNLLFSSNKFESEDEGFIFAFEEAVLKGDLFACEDLLRNLSITKLLRLAKKLTTRITQDLKYFGYSAYVRFRTSLDDSGRRKESIHIFICQQSWMVNLVVDISGSSKKLTSTAGLYISQPDGLSYVATNTNSLQLEPISIFFHMSTISVKQPPVALCA